jgi:hypothetical protein
MDLLLVFVTAGTLILRRYDFTTGMIDDEMGFMAFLFFSPLISSDLDCDSLSGSRLSNPTRTIITSNWFLAWGFSRWQMLEMK